MSRISIATHRGRLLRRTMSRDRSGFCSWGFGAETSKLEMSVTGHKRIVSRLERESRPY